MSLEFYLILLTDFVYAFTGDTALRLAAAFSTTPEFWLNLQKRWELETARDAAPDLAINPVAA